MRHASKALLVLLVLALVACTGSWKKDSAVSYEVTGVTLTEIEKTGSQMCTAGTIKPADCEKLKATYNKVRAAYLVAGDALIAAVRTEDALAKDQSMAAYQTAFAEATALLPELIRLAGDLGITGGK